MTIGLTVVLLLLAAVAGATLLQIAMQHPGSIGLDFAIYQARTHDFLTGQGFYTPAQLAGPFSMWSDRPPALYPPVMLYLTIPFAFGLPAVLWWAIPLGIITASLWRIRPTAWPLLAAILLYPRTWQILLYGNPSLWVYAALTAGFAWGWSAPFVMFKLTLAPFALPGIRSRRWWIGLAIAAALALPFGAMWLDYGRVLLNARNDSGPTYLLGEWPIALALVLALRSRRGAVVS